MSEQFLNPCSELHVRQHRIESLGFALHCVRSQFSPGDEWNSNDDAIASHLERLRPLMLQAARDLVAAGDRHDEWLKERRQEAAAQVNATESDTTDEEETT